MDPPNPLNTAYHVPAVSQLRPNIWGWWIGLTVLGGMIGEFFASNIADAVGRFISAFDNGQLIQMIPAAAWMETIVYSVFLGGILGLFQWFVYARMWDGNAQRSVMMLWFASWAVMILLELRFRHPPLDEPWIIQSALLGLIAGSLGGGIQMLVLRRQVQYASLWIASSGFGLMLGFAVFKFFVQDRLGFVYWEGLYDSSYYIGRLYQWAIYGVITGLTLEWLIRTTNKRRS